MNGQAGCSLRGRNPDVLTCIANLSNDEVFTPPESANRMLDTIAESWAADDGGASTRDIHSRTIGWPRPTSEPVVPHWLAPRRRISCESGTRPMATCRKSSSPGGAWPNGRRPPPTGRSLGRLPLILRKVLLRGVQSKGRIAPAPWPLSYFTDTSPTPSSPR
jgi:hypothetical protein